MKKTMLTIITAVSLLTSAIAMPMYANAECFVSDNARAELTDDNETITALVCYHYDLHICELIKSEANEKAAELTRAYFSEIDTSQMTEFELLMKRTDYEATLAVEIGLQMEEEKMKELIAPILEDIGVSSDTNVEYQYFGEFRCVLNAQQLAKAEKNELIYRITVDDDWNNGGYVGSPSIEELVGTTTTANASQATSTTTTVTTWEHSDSEMFTDVIEEFGDYTITFKEHGTFRYEKGSIKEELEAYSIGDKILIGFEYFMLHSQDIPRIDKIFMLSYASLALGDLNGDHYIDANDASIVLSEYSILSTSGNSLLTSVEKMAADVNKDSRIDSSDASCILGMYAYNATSSHPFETMEEYMSYIES